MRMIVAMVVALGFSLALGGSLPFDARCIRFQNATAWRGWYPALAM